MTGPFLRCTRLAAVLACITVPSIGMSQAADATRQGAGPADLVRRSNCFVSTGSHYGLNESLLRAIATIESNYEPRAVHHDADGTHDVGVMQVNSSHFARLQMFKITEADLLDKPCINVAVGAAILAGFVRRYGLTWRAIGAYGAGTAPSKEGARLDYARLVHRALQRASGQPAKASANAATVVAIEPAGAPSPRRMLVVE